MINAGARDVTTGMDVREKDHLWDAVNEIRTDQKEIRKELGAQGGVLSSINTQLSERCVVRGERLDAVEEKQKELETKVKEKQRELETRVNKLEDRMILASGVFIAVAFFGEKAFQVITAWFANKGA